MGEQIFDRIMIIDDNNLDLYVTSRIIGKAGLASSVLQYTSAREALKYLSENSQNIAVLPKVILVDIYMPEMSGFEFMAAYDQLPEQLKSYCKVYIVSSSLDENDIERANSDKNVVAFQEKPVTASFLQHLA